MNITVDNAELVEVGDRRMWRLALLAELSQEEREKHGFENAPNPVPLMHIIPEDILENYCAEYGFDPDDFDTLLETVLYLPWVDDPITHDHPKAPHLVDDPDEARQHVLSQVRAKRGNGRVRGRRGRPQLKMAAPRRMPGGPQPVVLLESGEEDPVEVLRREIPRSREHIAVRREAYRLVREQVRRERAERARREAARARGDWRRRESPQELRERLMAAAIRAERDVEDARRRREGRARQERRHPSG